MKSRKGFFELKDKIIKKSSEIYSQEIIASIEKKIEFIYNQIESQLVDDDIQDESVKTYNTGNNQPVTQYNNTSTNYASIDSLYANIGRKIKSLAKWSFIIDAIILFVFGIVFMTLDEEFIFVGMLIAICGPIIAFVSSWILYAFGELVDKTTENEKHTRDILAIMQLNNKQ